MLKLRRRTPESSPVTPGETFSYLSLHEMSCVLAVSRVEQVNSGLEQKFWSQIASHKKMRQIVCVWGKVRLREVELRSWAYTQLGGCRWIHGILSFEVCWYCMMLSNMFGVGLQSICYSGNLTWQCKNPPFWWLPGKVWIFHGYVGSLEGTPSFILLSSPFDAAFRFGREC